ncbi:emerin (Emery-Dreifuss muscular dystrophy) [Denticeps clupeoides]|uniref:LEM domain-containing protein n=1 Tax=Denticeps clupeoides TaxID=299321 RepID=A0AAY4CS33_9TELE|nr:emerin-like [Denticeps clupeoides]XP_028850205.1 emerin-like [Denticeps clupeoides]
MSDLSSKSVKEIADLLDQYGIKHGPIVDSTRSLYEKKLREAMANMPGKQSPDKTYYREEEEEVTYIHYHPPPVRSEAFGDVTRRHGAVEQTYEEEDTVDEPIISQTQTSYQNVSRSRPSPLRSTYETMAPEPKKSGGIPGWIRILAFVSIAAFLYFVYANMEADEQSPFDKIDA